MVAHAQPALGQEDLAQDQVEVAQNLKEVFSPKHLLRSDAHKHTLMTYIDWNKHSCDDCDTGCFIETP